MSYVVMNRILVDAAHAPAFEQGVTHSVAALRAAPGLRRVALLRPTVAGQPYVLTLEWDRQASFTAWRSAPGVQGGHAAPTAQLRDLLGGATSVDYLETVADQWTSGEVGATGHPPR